MTLAQEAAEYERRPEVLEAMRLIRSYRSLKRSIGWGTFKSRLWRILNPEQPYPGMRWDVPLRYCYAQLRVVAGWSTSDAYKQLFNSSDGQGG